MINCVCKMENLFSAHDSYEKRKKICQFPHCVFHWRWPNLVNCESKQQLRCFAIGSVRQACTAHSPDHWYTCKAFAIDRRLAAFYPIQTDMWFIISNFFDNRRKKERKKCHFVHFAQPTWAKNKFSYVQINFTLLFPFMVWRTRAIETESCATST